MIALIALVLQVITLMLGSNGSANQIVVIPPMPQCSPEEAQEETDLIEWDEYWSDAFFEYKNEFDALFNSYDVKRAKNGALMIRSTNGGSYRFAKKG